MTLSVIIISYNTKDLTLQTVESALTDLNRSSKTRGKSEVIVIDNNSSDDTVASLKKIKKDQQVKLTIIQNKENLGFSVTNNQGIKMARGSYVLLLNSDTIVQPGAIKTLLKTFENYPLDDSTSTLSSQKDRLDKLGILSATLINPNGTLQNQGGDLPSLPALFFHMTLLDDLPLVGKLLPTTQKTGFTQSTTLRYQLKDSRLIQREWVSAAALMIRKEVFAEVGLLDENIFMYGEDVEFCLRAKNHHWDIAIDPKATVTHLGSASSSPARAIQGEFAGYLYIWSKHKPLWQLPLVKIILKLGAFIRYLLFGTIFRDKHRAQAYRQFLKKTAN